MHTIPKPTGAGSTEAATRPLTVGGANSSAAIVAGSAAAAALAATTPIDRPQLADQVLRLPSRKASGELPAALAEQLLGDAPPAMEDLAGRRFPKSSAAVAVPELKAIERDAPRSTDAFIPDHADVEYAARLEPREMRLPKFIERTELLAALTGEAKPKTIFGPDDRRVYYSTAYPWRCVGRVESALGSGSGTMVGPRHLLTCAHIIDWRPNGGAGWVKFSPMYYNGSAPYGSAWAVRTYYKHKVAGPTLDSTESKYDYVVIVLDRPIGSATGWMGTKSYSDSWDGGAYWTHAGYPGDLTGGQRPTYQTGIALDGDFWTSDAHQRIEHRGDVWPGQSGGPFWGYWSGLPYAVATQSGQTAARNSASGGSDLVDLVLRARSEHP